MKHAKRILSIALSALLLCMPLLVPAAAADGPTPYGVPLALGAEEELPEEVAGEAAPLWKMLLDGMLGLLGIPLLVVLGGPLVLLTIGLVAGGVVVTAILGLPLLGIGAIIAAILGLF